MNKKIFIITPASRIRNLKKIKKSIDFKKITKWIIVYDLNSIKKKIKIFKQNKNIIELFYLDKSSVGGNSQRNFALKYLNKKKNKNFFIYYLDDDNIIHKNFYKLIDKIESKKIYTFDQLRRGKMYINGKFKYVKILKGNIVKQGLIDSGMFLPYFSLVNKIRWPRKVYASDGPYIIKCYLKNKKLHKYIPIVCSHYNYFKRNILESYKKEIKEKIYSFLR